MKTFLTLLAIIIVVGVLTGVVRGVKGPTAGAPATGAVGLQYCPDEMINNQMPGPGGAKPSYYIVNGERKEISEFDSAWVAANCNVPTQTVY
jgi:hypothetical protein